MLVAIVITRARMQIGIAYKCKTQNITNNEQLIIPNDVLMTEPLITAKMAIAHTGPVHLSMRFDPTSGYW